MKRIATCRACGSSALTPAFSLKTQMGKAGKKNLFGLDQGRIEYVVCDATRDANACGLIQNSAATLDQYGDIAPSGAYRSIRSQLRAAATEALEMISGRDCAALDIGCSDGALLSYYPRWVDRYGVDKTDAVDEIGAWATASQCAFPSADFDGVIGDTRFDIITAVNVFEELPDPKAALARMSSLLTDDGVIVLEVLYAPMTLARTNVEPLVDGRLNLFTLSAMERLCRDAGLKIFRGMLTDKEGGSVRLFVTHSNVDAYDFDPWYDRLARLWDEENALGFRLHSPYQAFEQRVGEARAAFGQMLHKIARRGETIHLVGASAASVELYHWAGAAKSSIEAAIHPGQPSPDAKLFPGGPALITETEARAMEPDYLIAPAALKREMLERWRDPILRGASLIVATPTPQIIDAANFAAEFGKSLAGGDTAGGVETLRAILGAAGGLRLVSDQSSSDDGQRESA